MNDISKQRAVELLGDIRKLSSQSKTIIIEKKAIIKENLKERLTNFMESAFFRDFKSGASTIMNSVKHKTVSAVSTVSRGIKRKREIAEAKRQLEEQQVRQSLEERQAILAKLLHSADVALEKNNSEIFAATMESINVLLTKSINKK